MSKAISKVRFTFRKTMLTLLTGMLTFTLGTLYNRDLDMIGWVLGTDVIIASIVGFIYLPDFIRTITDILAEYRVGQALTPSKQDLLSALAKDIEKDSSTNQIEEVKLRQDVERMKLELQNAKSVIIKQNEVIELQKQLSNQEQEQEQEQIKEAFSDIDIDGNPL